MKTPQHLTTLAILFFFITCSSAASSEAANGASGPDVVSSRSAEVSSSSSSSASGALLGTPTPKPVGRKDAPVDGKDGRPHKGPFIETEAQRDRQKAKESGQEEVLQPGVKPKPKDQSGNPKLTENFEEPVPESNDGVMDDPNRVGPKEGTRGTEGGISEKSRGKKENLEGQLTEKLPDQPKEAPPLPHSEQEKLAAVEEADPKPTAEVEKLKAKVEELELGGLSVSIFALVLLLHTQLLKKPEDLPEKPHDIPHPSPATGPKKDPLAITQPSSTGDMAGLDSNGLIQPLHSFLLAFTMIIFSEIGDKTFLVAALMAMKHPPLLVFSAAFAALFVMTILSSALGHAVPVLLSVRVTNFLAAILFLVFGAKMLREGYALSPSAGVGEEMREVEMELEEKEQLARQYNRRRSSVTPYILESGRGSRKSRATSRLPAPPDSPPSSPDSRSPSPSRTAAFTGILAGVNNLCSFLLSPAWAQTFVMTFLGEWGDRSQIATIAMSAGQDYWWVATGSLFGHSICTAIAVIGGRAIAGRVSLRVGKSFLLRTVVSTLIGFSFKLHLEELSRLLFSASYTSPKLSTTNNRLGLHLT